VKPGDRVFDVVVQGETVARDLDIAAKADGPMRSIAGMWKNVLIGDRLEIELRPKGPLAPVLCGVQITREE